VPNLYRLTENSTHLLKTTSVTVNGEKMNFLIVKNQPKPAAEVTKPAARKAKTTDQRPAA
jgi:hypothetical protein